MTANAEDFRAVEILARLEVKRGRVAQGEAVLKDYQTRHPRDASAALVRLEIDRYLDRPIDLLARTEELTVLDPKNEDAWYRTGLLYYERVAHAGSNVTAAQKRSSIHRGLEALERALQLKPDQPEALVYQNLLYRQEALLETDPKKAEQLTAKADAARARAIALIKERKAKAQ